MLRKGRVATDRSRDHSGGMGHSIEDTQDRDRRREITGVVCCANHPPQTHTGARAFKAKGVSGLGAFIWCVSVCLQDHRNPEARLSPVREYKGVWGCFRDLLMGSVRCQQAANWVGRWWN